MHERIGQSAAAALAIGAAILMGSTSQAAAQARGVIIQIPDDVAPGSPRPAAAPPAPPPAAAAPSAPMPTPAGPPTPTAPKSACQGAACSASDAWHVLNTANRTCLVLSKNDLKGGRDVRKLAALLPAPMFVVASGACP